MIARSTHKVLTGRRSVRKFKEQEPIPEHVMGRIVKAAAFAPSACNLQPIDYLAVTSQASKERISPHLRWATNLNDEMPKTGERPSLYIIPLMDREKIARLNEVKNIDRRLLENAHLISLGCAVANLVNQAHAEGIGSCIVGAIDERAIRVDFGIAAKYSIPLVIALGYPLESPRIELVAGDSPPTYYRDGNGVWVVQKREVEIKAI